MTIRRSIAPHVAAVAVASVALVLGVSTAGPASAAMDSNCWLVIPEPSTDGNKVYSTTSVYCTTIYDSTAVQVGNRIQESVLGIWNNRTAWVYNYSTGTTGLSVSNNYVCNGHGTDTWRAAGQGRTSDNGETVSYGAARSLTC